MVEPVRRRATYAEYMAFTETAEGKYEYVDGEIVPMSGGTIVHARLISRMTALLQGALRDRPCVVFPADQRVRIRAADRATYPDLHVVCSAIEADADDSHAIVNFMAIIEVMSDSSIASDRGDKFAAYRKLRSLRDYVLIAQHERSIDVYRRDGRRWILDVYGPGESFALESLDVTLSVDEVYADNLGPILT
jgi:Uma2 family endonuclease